MHRLTPLLALLALLLFAPGSASAQTPPALSVTDRGTFIVFPDRISFNAHISSGVPVTQVVLEYGVDKRTCGDITAKAFPKFTPGTELDVNWTWEMLQTGSEPPGAVIWYRWRVIDRDGNSAVTPDARVTWIDKTYSWRQVSGGDLTLHWYDGESAFANELLESMIGGVEQLARMTGVRPQAPIHLYVYGDTTEMQEAILYEPSWTGGVAYPANNITIIGIDQANLEWGKRTVIHELTHLIVGQMTFSCGENVPTWLNEGIAVYAEGGLDAWSEARFRQAVQANALISVRDLTNGFSAHPDLADLSYSQSYSLVSYLVERYGSTQLLALFERLRAGDTVEAGLQGVYGIGLEALEDGWRGWLGVGPRQGSTTAERLQPTPMPTYAPLAAAPTSAVGPPERTVAPTATAAPTGAPTTTMTAVAEAGEPAGGIVEAPPPPGFDLRLISAAALFLGGAGLAGTASWKLFGRRR
jgi:hypothetical protein